jgi:hypothetical protein
MSCRNQQKRVHMNSIGIITQCLGRECSTNSFCASQFYSVQKTRISRWLCLTSTPAFSYYRIHSHSFQFRKLPSSFHLPSPWTLSHIFRTAASKWTKDNTAPRHGDTRERSGSHRVCQHLHLKRYETLQASILLPISTLLISLPLFFMEILLLSVPTSLTNYFDTCDEAGHQ